MGGEQADSACWLARYEGGGLEELADRSRRPASCPHQMPGHIEAAVLEVRRMRPFWGPHSVALELARRRVEPMPSESGIYRCLVRAGVIDPVRRHRRQENWKRWERGRPMELWQMDVVGGFLVADGSTAKALTGLDVHSRFCVSARLMPRERTQLVCDGLAAAMTYTVTQVNDAGGIPEGPPPVMFGLALGVLTLLLTRARIRQHTRGGIPPGFPSDRRSLN